MTEPLAIQVYYDEIMASLEAALEEGSTEMTIDVGDTLRMGYLLSFLRLIPGLLEMPPHADVVIVHRLLSELEAYGDIDAG